MSDPKLPDRIHAYFKNGGGAVGTGPSGVGAREMGFRDYLRATPAREHAEELRNCLRNIERLLGIESYPRMHARIRDLLARTEEREPHDTVSIANGDPPHEERDDADAE